MQIHTRVQPGECTAASLGISLALFDNLLQAPAEQGADRSALLRCHHPDLAEQRGVQLEGNIGFHHTVLRAARLYVRAFRFADREKVDDQEHKGVCDEFVNLRAHSGGRVGQTDPEPHS